MFLVLSISGWMCAMTGCPSPERASPVARRDSAVQNRDQPTNQTASTGSLKVDSSDVGLRSNAMTETNIRLIDATQRSGINFVHQDASTGDFHLMETMTGGLALFDLDGDDLTDVFFCSGKSLEEPNSSGGLAERTDSPAVFFHNMGGLKFRDITQSARLDGLGFGLGAAVGDFDNDGFRDLYLSNFGPNQLWHNNGDGTFSLDTTAEVAHGVRFGAGVCFADVNGDASLDLVVGSYVKFSPADVQG